MKEGVDAFEVTTAADAKDVSATRIKELYNILIDKIDENK
jgi:hypothetical protein